MNIPTHMPRLKGFRYPSEIIAYAVWTYHGFALSTASVEDLLAARGVIVSRDAVRLWVNRFGQHFANCIRRDRPRPNNKWHIDEVVITIRGRKHWLWRAIDANGDVLDIRVQTRRNARCFAASDSWVLYGPSLHEAPTAGLMTADLRHSLHRGPMSGEGVWKLG